MERLEKVVSSKLKKSARALICAAGIGLSVLCSSCGVNSGYDAIPRIRTGSFFGSLGMNFLELGHLGIHNLSEKNGLVYTCDAGFIDLAHFRNAADLTKYLTEKTFRHLMENETEFSFKLKEPSRYFVKLNYPKNWENLVEERKEVIANDISIGLGEYFAYAGVTWHEILTWFGYTWMGIISERPSAFSWEDGFSNLLGSYVGARALRDTEDRFSEAVTLAFKKELEKLNVQPKHVARRADKKIRGHWYSGSLLFINMKKRNFDIGFDDGFVTPFLIPDFSECSGAKPKAYPTPNLDFLSEYGFSVKFEVEPRVWEKEKILRAAYLGKNKRKKRVEPAVHFASIMGYIKKDAVRRYGFDVDSP